MFTGIIETLGKVSAVDVTGEDRSFTIDTGKLDLADTNIGDSIAVNGACLSVVDKSNNTITTDVSIETLNRTTLHDAVAGTPVNLERALKLSDRLHGHFISGHVDGIGHVVEHRPQGRSVEFIIEAPDALRRFICEKGSIGVDGVSLTVNEVQVNRFAVNIIPHTMQETLFGAYDTGSRVNLEVDLIARYLDSLNQSRA